MELKEEVKQAALDWLDEHGDEVVDGGASGKVSAAVVRRGENSPAHASGLVTTMLDVIDGYEGVEVQETSAGTWRLRDRSRSCWNCREPAFMAYRKKSVPEPTVEELAQDAVDAWLRDHGSRARTMNALAAKLSKQGR